jgi:peptidoglycan/LPS O-acetylase OafA/YrhL
VPAFWWLGKLAQFYLVFPWLLRFFAGVGPGRACIIACVIPWIAWVVLTRLASQVPWSTLATVHYLIYFNLPVRLPEFAIGMWLASAWNRTAPLVHGRQRTTVARSWVTLVVGPLCVGLTLFLLLHKDLLDQLNHPFNHIYLVFWCLCGIIAVLRWPLALRLGSLRLTLELAGTSYGIYLLHQPLLGYANQWLASLLSPSIRFAVLLIGIGLLCYRAAAWLNILVYRMINTSGRI